jgi:hypothetical protein
MAPQAEAAPPAMPVPPFAQMLARLRQGKGAPHGR